MLALVALVGGVLVFLAVGVGVCLVFGFGVFGFVFVGFRFTCWFRWFEVWVGVGWFGV